MRFVMDEPATRCNSCPFNGGCTSGGCVYQPRIVRYDGQTIQHVAWKLAEQDGYTFGRCARIDDYIRQVRDIIVALDHAAELQDVGDLG